MLHFSVSVMNRLNKIKSGIFLPCMISLVLRGRPFDILGRGLPVLFFCFVFEEKKYWLWICQKNINWLQRELQKYIWPQEIRKRKYSGSASKNS